MEDWWSKAYLDAGSPILAQRFTTEAASTLPFAAETVSLDDLFSAVTLQQARLKNDQQIPVWEPTT